MLQLTRYTCKVKAEYLEGSRVRFLWPCGHTRTETLMVGPKGRGSRRLRKPMAPEIVRKLVHYWNRAGGVNSPSCPTCGEPK